MTELLYQGKPSMRYLVVTSWWIVIIAGMIAATGMLVLWGNKIAFTLSRFLMIFLVSFVLYFCYEIYKLKTYKYEITNDQIVFQSWRALTSKVNTVPFSKITNVEMSQHVLEKILGLWSVHIQTAGMGLAKAEVVFVGLNEADAKKIRDLIARKIR